MFLIPRTRGLIITGFVLGNLFVLALAGYFLYQSRQQYEQRARIASQNIAQAIDQSLTSSIEKIDLALKAVTDELEQQLAAGGVQERSINALMATYEPRISGLESIRGTNAAGVMAFGKGLDKNAPASYAGRDYFIYLRDHADAGLQITKPIVGRVSHKWIIAFARRYNYPDGSFGGVVSAAVTIDHFSEMLSRYDIGPHGGITLRDADLGQITRYPKSSDEQAGKVGNTVVSPKLRELVRSGVSQATYHATTPIDRTERILTFHRLSIAPMIATVGLARKDYLAEWNGEVLKTSLLAASFMLLSLVSAVIQMRFLKQNARESARNQLYLKNASDGIHILDESGAIVEANDRFCRMLGYECGEVIGMNVSQWEARWPEKTLIEDMLPELLRSEKAIVFETLNRRKNGEVIEVEVNAAGIQLEGKKYLYVSSRDITERKLAEKNSLERERRYRILFESANDGIFLLDGTRFLDCNQRGAAMYGRSKEEVVGRTPMDLSPVTQSDGRLSSVVAEEKTRAALEGVPQVFEWLSLHVDGTPYHVEVTLNRLELDGSVRLLAILRDITERMDLQSEREKSQRLESLGLLAGGIAHDFNNILTGILGNVSFARMLVGEEHKAAPRLAECEKAVQRAGELTQQLLTFARGGEPVRAAMDTKRVIEESLSLVLRGSAVKGALVCPPDIWWLDADAGQMSQVFNNLLINARQAMPNGGTITLTMENLSVRTGDPFAVRPGPYVRIAVKDEGVGIPADSLQKIFDPYFTTKPQGSGLGLSSVYSIVRRHGGLVTVTSQPGEGSTFTLLVPAAKGRSSSSTGCGSEASAMHGTGKILVMDDEEMIRQIAAAMLESLGYAVDCCADGSEAVAMHAAARETGTPYAAIILDLTVPGGVGGLEAASIIRERDPYAALIVSSGYSNDMVVAGYRQFGFSGSVVKPYALRDMAAEVSRVVKGNS